MRKLSIFFSLFLFTFLFIGCDNEMTVSIKKSGTLTVQVVDENKTGISETDVWVYDYETSYYQKETTDESGFVSSIKLLQGQYECGASGKKGNAVYTDEKSVQVFAGENTKVVLNPFENAGNISLKFVSYYDETSLTGLNVALITSYDSYEADEIIESAYFIGKIDSEGKVKFTNVPTGSYHVFLYNDSGSWNGHDGTWLRVKKGEDTNYTIEVYYWD